MSTLPHDQQETATPATLTQIAEYNATAAALADLRQRFAGVIFDVTKPAEMELARKARRELVGLRTALAAKREEIKKPHLERGRLIDAEAKRITSELLALEDPIDEQIRKEEKRKETERAAREQVERERVAGIREKIEAMRGLVPAAVTQTTAEVAEAVAGLQAREIAADVFAEFVDEATRVRTATLTKLGEMYDAGVARETEAARLKSEREQLERDQAAERERQSAARALERQQERERKEQAEREEAERKAQRDREEEERKARDAVRIRLDFIRGQPVEMVGQSSEFIAKGIELLLASTVESINAGLFAGSADEANRLLAEAVDKMSAMRIDAQRRESLAAEEERQAHDRFLLAEEQRRQKEAQAEEERQREAEAQRLQLLEQRAAEHRERLKGYEHMTAEAALYAAADVCKQREVYTDHAAREEVAVICEAVLSREKRAPRTRRAPAAETGTQP